MSLSALYQTIFVTAGFFVFSLGFIEMEILTPIECFCFGTAFLSLAVLRNVIERKTNKKATLIAAKQPLAHNKINEQTCEWIQKYGVWRHKKNGLYYCPHCAPNPSPLSTDNDNSFLCNKCHNGFGEGEVFRVDW